MKKALALALGLAMGGSVLWSAPVRNDPAELPLPRLPQYFNKCRNLDRWLQQGNFGMVIKVGKELLKDFVVEDAYTAFCIAAAYGSMDPDPDEAEDYYEESLEYLQHAIDWGFRNAAILETSAYFEKVRKSKDHAKGFEKLVKEVTKAAEKDAEKLKREFRSKLEEAASEATKKTMKLGGKTTSGEEVTAEKFAGKPLLVVVLRPRNDAVAVALPGILKAAAAAAEKGVQVVGAVYNYSYTPRLEKEAAAFVAAAKLPFPCVMVDRSWAKEYEILNLPSHLLVNAQGKVLEKVEGFQDDEWRLMALVDVLAEKGK